MTRLKHLPYKPELRMGYSTFLGIPAPILEYATAYTVSEDEDSLQFPAYMFYPTTNELSPFRQNHRFREHRQII